MGSEVRGKKSDEEEVATRECSRETVSNRTDALWCSSMVYVEGEASMRKFQKENEGEQQALSIVQRSYH